MQSARLLQMLCPVCNTWPFPVSAGDISSCSVADGCVLSAADVLCLRSGCNTWSFPQCLQDTSHPAADVVSCLQPMWCTEGLLQQVVLSTVLQDASPPLLLQMLCPVCSRCGYTSPAYHIWSSTHQQCLQETSPPLLLQMLCPVFRRHLLLSCCRCCVLSSGDIPSSPAADGVSCLQETSPPLLLQMLCAVFRRHLLLSCCRCCVLSSGDISSSPAADAVSCLQQMC